MSRSPEKNLPPVTELALAALVATVAGGIYIASHIPKIGSLTPAIVLTAVAVAFLAVGLAMTARLKDFAWVTFRQVGGWTILAYLVIAGMLEFVFVFDHTPGRVLVLLSVLLAVLALDVPLILAFSVARYQPAQPRRSGARTT